MFRWYENKTLSKHSFFLFLFLETSVILGFAKNDLFFFLIPLRRSWSALLRSVKTLTDIEELQVGTRLQSLHQAPFSPPWPPKTLQRRGPPLDWFSLQTGTPVGYGSPKTDMAQSAIALLLLISRKRGTLT